MVSLLGGLNRESWALSDGATGGRYTLGSLGGAAQCPLLHPPSYAQRASSYQDTNVLPGSVGTSSLTGSFWLDIFREKLYTHTHTPLPQPHTSQPTHLLGRCPLLVHSATQTYFHIKKYLWWDMPPGRVLASCLHLDYPLTLFKPPSQVV